MRNLIESRYGFEVLLENACASAGITRVADLTQMDCLGVPVCQAIRPKSKNYVVSQGKGGDIQSARISAIMESLEFFHGENIKSDLEEDVEVLKPILPYDIYELPRIGDSDPKKSLTISWSAMLNVINGHHSFFPWDSINLDFTINKPCSIFRSTSNGFCGGESDESALRHGYLEVLERHILATGDKVRIKIDASVCDILPRECKSIMDYGFKMAVYAYESIIKIPTFKVVIYSPAEGLAFSGTCCDPDVEIALRKAYYEAAQSRLTHITGSRDDLTYISYRIKSEYCSSSMAAPPYVCLSDYIRVCGTSLQAKGLNSNGYLIDRIVLSGYKSILIKNISLEKIGIPFYVVVIPGMQFNEKHLL